MIHANKLTRFIAVMRYGNRESAIKECESMLEDLKTNPIPRRLPDEKDVTLDQAITALIAVKQRSGISIGYSRSLLQYLRMFARGRGDMLLRDVTAQHLEDWLDGRGEKGSTRMSNAGRFSSLFSFGVRRGWIPDNPYKRLEPIRVEHRVPTVMPVKQCARALVWTRDHKPRLLAWLVLCMFAGVRPEEADQLTWSCVDFDDNTIRIDETVSKVRRRRIVRAMPVTFAWLRVAQGVGASLPLPKASRRHAQRLLRNALKMPKWPQDILRHTCATNWVAVWEDPAKVAYQLGNSPGIIYRHYRDIVKQRDAERFWALWPRGHKPKGRTADVQSKSLTSNPRAMFASGPANIVPMPVENVDHSQNGNGDVASEAVW